MRGYNPLIIPLWAGLGFSASQKGGVALHPLRRLRNSLSPAEWREVKSFPLAALCAVCSDFLFMA